MNILRHGTEVGRAKTDIFRLNLEESQGLLDDRFVRQVFGTKVFVLGLIVEKGLNEMNDM